MKFPTLEEKLDHYTRVDENGCFVWIGALTGTGYANVRGNGKMLRGARVSYELHVGSIPDGYEIDHLCRNPACINPAHLEPVLPRVNKLRGIGWAGTNSRKTHCVHGHEYTPENTRLDHRGHRTCRTCHRAYQASWVRRRRAERRNA